MKNFLDSRYKVNISEVIENNAIVVTYDDDDEEEIPLDEEAMNTFSRKDSFISALSDFLKKTFWKSNELILSFGAPAVNDIAQTLKAYQMRNAKVSHDKLVLHILTDIEKPMTSKNRHSSLISMSKQISKYLREVHYQNGEKLTGFRTKPLLGKPVGKVVAGSLGAFPEFILPTFPCDKTQKGFCSPCFFSKVEMGDASEAEIYRSFEIQTKFIIDNFGEYVIKCQLREDEETKSLWDVTLCFASNGSLFSNCETTRQGRYNAFKMLSDEIEKRKLRSLVYIETCADDYITLTKSDEMDDLLPLFKKLNVVFVCGFESLDDFTRDVLYAKRMTVQEFEKVIDINNKVGLQTGAFLYTGFYAMTQKEIVIDFINSLCYLTKMNAVPVVMVPKLHEFTLPHLLYKYQKYNLLEPYTVMQIAKIAVWITRAIPAPIHKDRWMMSDLLDDIPASSTSVFSNERKIMCDDCVKLIQDVLQDIRSSMNYSLFDEAENIIKNCHRGCYERYLKALDDEDSLISSRPLIDRTTELLEFAHQKSNQYAQSVLYARKLSKAKEPSKSYIRKELLCFGINVDKSTLIYLRALNESFGTNKFVHVAQVRLPDGSYVNAPVLEEYCKLSFYSIKVDNDNVWLYRNEIRLFEIHISPVPEWISKSLSDGTSAAEVLNIHGHNTLSLVRHKPCYFKTINKGCKFCSNDCTSQNSYNIASPKQIAEAVEVALNENNSYSLALSGGSLTVPDRGAIYFSEIAKEVLKHTPNLGISVELAPPETDEYIEILIEAGVKTIIMNLEFNNDAIRKEICPGKYEISQARYFESLKYAVKRLGAGRVSSVLITGIEDVTSTIEGAKKLIDIGVIPTVIPFRPYDNCEMKDYKVSNPDDLVLIENEINQYIDKKGFEYKRPYGCLNCNACIGTALCLSHDGHQHVQRGE
jgi:uncharacterized Fe-S cluster-containing MiaB family protein